MTENIGFDIHLNVPYEEAIEKVGAALKTEGFGILTRIDVKATIKEKLDADFRPYVILGACNPHLAHRALLTDPAVGLMLPCNVTVEAKPEGESLIRIANPEVMMQAGQLGIHPTLREVAAEARIKLERVSKLLAKN